MSKPDVPKKRKFTSGVTSSAQPRYALVPFKALRRAIRRFELGIERHGDGAWNALSPNQKALEDKAFTIERAAHVIDHAYKLIAKASGQIPDDGDDDAAAIVWGGLYLCEATEPKEKK